MPVKVSLNAYFERIGFAGSIAPTVATLESLLALHPASIPFENLDTLRGEPVALDQPSLERKLLAERRGGYCFEHNLLLLRILEDLEFTARPLLARSLWTDPENQQVSHALLLVEINGQNYIADVGHGGLSLTAPLRLRADVEQSTPHETFRLVSSEGVWTLEVELSGSWRPVYAFTLDQVSDDEIAAVSARVGVDLDAAMSSSLRVALAPPGRRVKLLDRGLTVQPVGGEAEKRELGSLSELRTVLAEEFGLVPPDDPRLAEALARLFPLPPDTPDRAPV